MAATAFVLYNLAKKAIGGGVLQLGVTPLKLKLTTSASNAETLTLSTFASVTNEIAIQGGYLANGRALQSMVWTVGASAKSYKFNAADLTITASGAHLVDVKYAVIGVSGGNALCWSKLSTAQFTVTSPNTLTIQFNTLGIFEMH